MIELIPNIKDTKNLLEYLNKENYCFNKFVLRN